MPLNLRCFYLFNIRDIFIWTWLLSQDLFKILFNANFEWTSIPRWLSKSTFKLFSPNQQPDSHQPIAPNRIHSWSYSISKSSGSPWSRRHCTKRITTNADPYNWPVHWPVPTGERFSSTSATKYNQSTFKIHYLKQKNNLSHRLITGCNQLSIVDFSRSFRPGNKVWFMDFC